MIELCLARRAGTPDEVGPLGALLMGLMDGGHTAVYRFGALAPK